MEGEAKRNDLQSLFGAIKATDDLESQISFVNQIGDSYQLENPDVVLLINLLNTLWDTDTCIGVSRCILHKTVLHTATKYLEPDITDYLSQYLILGTKASMWCRNHLQMTLTVEEFQDEQHRILFYQLILDTLSFSSAVITSITKSPPLGEVDMLIVKNFIFEALSVTKTLILEFKRIELITAEALKLGQVVLDAAIKLCRAYYQAIRCKSQGTNVVKNEESIINEVNDYASHIISITALSIKILFEIGTFAASAGGRLVTLLNISWKGVVCLLQLDKEVFSENVDVGEIVLTLLSLTVDSLRCASEAWSASSAVTAPLIDAKRAFLPIKFYLINSVRISSEFPCNTMKICKQVVRTVVLVSALCIILSREVHLKAVSEAMTELLEPTSYILLRTLLNSSEVKFDSKLQILEWIFPCEMDSCTFDLKRDTFITELSASLDSVFDVGCDDLPVSESLLLGKIYCSLNLLKASSSFREEVLLEISQKLDNLLAVFMNEAVFSAILGLQISVLSISGPSTVVIWQPMYSFVLISLKTFMIVASSSRFVWIEMETFLLQNLFHPHFLCLEFVKQLLCFLICHAEINMVNQFFEKLCLLLKTVASSEPSISPSAALRKMARSISDLLSYAKPSTVDQVYIIITREDKTDISSLMYVALLMEGFPLGSLSENFKIVANRKIVAAFVSFLENNSTQLGMDAASLSCNSYLLGLPVHALSSALSSCHIKGSDVNGKFISQLLKFTTTLIKTFRNVGEDMKDQYAKLLGAILALISNAKHIYGSDEIEEIILELRSIFVKPDATLSQCQPYLSTFLAGLSHIQIADDEENPISAAIWELYHSLLQEQHWAFVHLALATFGYFAARTSCTQLWRFVPKNAALSFDSITGSEANYDTFMTELKGFLEKEGALCDASSCKEQLIYLIQEGIALRRLLITSNTMNAISRDQTVEIDDHEKCTSNKKRKLPEGICEGMELLQNGLNAMSNALSQSDSVELNEEFSTHISSLRDAISHLVGFSNTNFYSL